MPRPRRPVADGLVYHVISRGSNRQPVFHGEGDYEALAAGAAAAVVGVRAPDARRDGAGRHPPQQRDEPALRGALLGCPSLPAAQTRSYHSSPWSAAKDDAEWKIVLKPLSTQIEIR